MPDAACRDVPEFVEVDDSEDVHFRRQVCATCPERAVCLNVALRTHPTLDHGIWGGTTRRQRARMRRGLGITFAPVSTDVVLHALAGARRQGRRSRIVDEGAA